MDILRRSCQVRRSVITGATAVSARASSQNRKKAVTSCDIALSSFDASYSITYGERWPSTRLGLLCNKKYVAVINRAAPNYTQHLQRFKELGCMDVGARYSSNCRQLKTAQVANALKNNTEHTEQNSTEYTEQNSTEQSRTPRRKMTDDQLSDASDALPPGKYPDLYRNITDAGTYISSKPGSDRLLLPQPGMATDQLPVHDFIPAQTMKGVEEFRDDKDIFNKYGVDTEPGEGPGVTITYADNFLPWPEMLTVMAFTQSDISRFPKPVMDHGLYDHYALDGASLLPVLLLGIEPGDSVLDMCAGPGGKTLAILQSCLTGLLQSNEKSASRKRRIESMLQQFYSPDSSLLAHHIVTESDGCFLQGTYNSFDRVLVDAPCLTDRHSLLEPDNNIFKKNRLKERLAMPEVQSALLVEALKQVRVGGSVVYSTCTLSPVQNDGVVHLALNRLWDNTDIQCRVVNYSNCLEPFKFLYRVSEAELGLRYGQSVLPWVPNNYGPMYCARLQRTQ